MTAFCRACGRELPTLPHTVRVLPHDALGSRVRCRGSLKGGYPFGEAVS